MSWRRSKAFEQFSTRMLMALGTGTFLSLGLVIFMKHNGDFGAPLLRSPSDPPTLTAVLLLCCSQSHWCCRGWATTERPAARSFHPASRCDRRLPTA